MDRKNYQALILVLCLSVAACKKDKPDPTPDTLPGASGNVYVVCEGNFNAGDASLYAYQPSKDSAYGDLYNAANNAPLGDVFQSMQHIGNSLFLCVNNSDRVAVVSAIDWKQSATLKVSKPRYILPISADKAYITSEYSNKVYILDPLGQRITGSLALPSINTEGMCLYNNYAFICAWDTSCNKLYEVDVNTDQLVQSITFPGYAPQEILMDKEQMLWVLSGDQPYGKPAMLTRLDPSSGEIMISYAFPANTDPVKPVMNATRDTVYFLEAYNTGTQQNGVYRMDIHATNLPVQPFIAAKSYQYFWALGVDPVSDQLYVGDAKDFQQKGTVYIYRPDGTAVSNFNVGPGPGHFYFDN